MNGEQSKATRPTRKSASDSYNYMEINKVAAMRKYSLKNK